MAINTIAADMYRRLTAGEVPKLEEVRRAFFDLAQAGESIPRDEVFSSTVVTPEVRALIEPLPVQSAAPTAKPLRPLLTNTGEPLEALSLPEKIATPREGILAPTHEERVSVTEKGFKETNASLRRKLGQHGFLEDPTRRNIQDLDAQESLTYFVRRGQEVILHETLEGREPYLTTKTLARDVRKVNVEEFGPRNINAQQPGEGRSIT